MKKPLIVVLTGAGISKESGIPTFRDAGGLWHNFRIEDVATAEAWQTNPEAVLEFYNMRRRQLRQVQPNAAHKALARLETDFPVQIITQNVDDLHERAGSRNVLHLHGELCKARSERRPDLIYPWCKDLHLGNKAGDGAQLRPHIVLFGEAVPELPKAAELVRKADIFLIVGTSLQVYPAAGLVHETRPGVPVYYIDPAAQAVPVPNPLHLIREPATRGVPQVIQNIRDDFNA